MAKNLMGLIEQKLAGRIMQNIGEIIDETFHGGHSEMAIIFSDEALHLKYASLCRSVKTVKYGTVETNDGSFVWISPKGSRFARFFHKWTYFEISFYVVCQPDGNEFIVGIINDKLIFIDDENKIPVFVLNGMTYELIDEIIDSIRPDNEKRPPSFWEDEETELDDIYR